MEVDLPFNGSGPKRALVGGAVGVVGGTGGSAGAGAGASSLSPSQSPTAQREFSIFTACCGGGSGCCAKVRRDKLFRSNSLLTKGFFFFRERTTELPSLMRGGKFKGSSRREVVKYAILGKRTSFFCLERKVFFLSLSSLEEENTAAGNNQGIFLKERPGL